MSPSRVFLEGFKTATSAGGYNMPTCKSLQFGAQFDYQHVRIHLYSRHVALSGSGAWDYVSLRSVITLPVYKKTTTLIVWGCISQHQGICQQNIPAAPVLCMLSFSLGNTHILKFNYDGMHIFIISQDTISFWSIYWCLHWNGLSEPQFCYIVIKWPNENKYKGAAMNWW